MAEDPRSVSDLIAGAFTQLSNLLQSEIQLARAEIAEKMTEAGFGIGLIAAGSIFTVAALVLHLLALAALLVQLGLSQPLADALAGIAGLLVSGLLIWLGLGRLRSDALTPRRTMTQLQRDAATVKEHVS